MHDSNILQRCFFDGFNCDLRRDIDAEGIKNSIPSDDPNLVRLACYSYIVGRQLAACEVIKDKYQLQGIWDVFLLLVLYTDYDKWCLRKYSDLEYMGEPFCTIKIRGHENYDNTEPMDVDRNNFYSMLRKLHDDTKHKGDLLYDVLFGLEAHIIFQAEFEGVGTFLFYSDSQYNEFYRSEPEEADEPFVDRHVDEAFDGLDELFWLYHILKCVNVSRDMAVFNFESAEEAV